MIEVEIDGRKIEVPEGSMLMEAANRLGIYVPHFCYHKKLTIAANCRMCLVEVEKAPKPMPACATPVVEGMKVFTRSARAIAAQKATMEFLLINHPLDCPHSVGLREAGAKLGDGVFADQSSARLPDLRSGRRVSAAGSCGWLWRLGEPLCRAQARRVS